MKGGKFSISFSPPKFSKVVRVVYVETRFLEQLTESAVKVLGRRGAVAQALGYRNSTRLNKILEGKVGMIFTRFVKLCEISGIPLEEALRYVVAVVPYGSRTKETLQDLLLNQKLTLTT
jgi:hypothetical protein